MPYPYSKDGEATKIAPKEILALRYRLEIPLKKQFYELVKLAEEEKITCRQLDNLIENICIDPITLKAQTEITEALRDNHINISIHDALKSPEEFRVIYSNQTQPSAEDDVLSKIIKKLEDAINDQNSKYSIAEKQQIKALQIFIEEQKTSGTLDNVAIQEQINQMKNKLNQPGNTLFSKSSAAMRLVNQVLQDIDKNKRPIYERKK
jgi:hypothetical protein